MVSAGHIAFEVADDHMYPRQPFIGQFRRRDFGDMMVAFGQYLERGKGIGMQGLLGRNGLLGKGLDAVLVYPANRFHGNKAQLPVIVLTGHQDGRLAIGTTPSFARALAADEGVVQFDDAFQSVQAILVSHRNPQFP